MTEKVEMAEPGVVCAAASVGDVEGLAALLRAGASPDDRFSEGVRAPNGKEAVVSGLMTALYAAAVGAHAQCVEMLLAAGADPSAAAQHGWTPLMAACVADAGQAPGSGHGERILRMLIAAGADLDAKDHDGKACAMWAATYHGAPFLRILAEAGADLRSSDMHGRDALWQARRNMDEEAASFIQGWVASREQREDLQGSVSPASKGRRAGGSI